MRRLSISALCLVLLFVQCRKAEVKPVEEHIELTEFSLTASSGGKSTIEGLVVNWSEGDKIYVVDMDATGSGLLGYLSAENGGIASTTFSGSIIAPTAGHRCLFYYVGLNTFTVNSSGEYTYSVSNQNGLLSGDSDLDIANRFQLLKSTASVTVTADMIKNHNFGSSHVSFKGMMAISRLNIQLAGTAYSGTVNVTGGYATATLNAKTGALTPVSDTITLNNANGDYYMAVIPADQSDGGSSQTLRFATATDDRVDMTSTVAANKFYNRTTAKAVNMVWSATVVTIPVCAKHGGWGGNTGTASSGGVVTGKNVDEQGVCWGTAADPTVSGSHYAHNYEYAPGLFTPKNTIINPTYTGFMSGLTPSATYHVRAYIRKGTQVKYGNDITFTVPATPAQAQTVDLGLPSGLLWATCNLGATTPEGYGDYYQWGDNAACSTRDESAAAGQGYYVICWWTSYRFNANGATNPFALTKYSHADGSANWYSGAGSPDGKMELDLADDCVNQVLGGEWRLPTNAEWTELKNNTNRSWTTQNGVNGYLFTSTINGNTLFIPAAGQRNSTRLEDGGTVGRYWSRSLYTGSEYSNSALQTKMQSSGLTQTNSGRNLGFSVRPVNTMNYNANINNPGHEIW